MRMSSPASSPSPLPPPPPRDSVHVTVTPWLGAVVWLFIACFHIISGAFLTLVGVLYLYLRATAVSLLDNVELYNIAVHRRHFRLIAVVYMAVACIHLHELALMILRSIRAGRVTFTGPPAPRSVGSVSIASASIIAPPWVPVESSAKRISIAARIWRSIKWFVLWLWQSFAVTDPNYGVVYIGREIIQTLLQTYQAYRLSYLVARPWMNSVFVLLLVVSCCTTPLVRLTRRLTTGSARLLCLVVNLMLDLVANIVLPVILFLPYGVDYNPVTRTFDTGSWYDDLWFMNVVNEWQMLFVTSWADGFSKLFIAYSVTRSLRSIPKLVRIRPTTVTKRTLQVYPSHASTIASTAMDSFSQHGIDVSTWRARLERWGQWLLLGWGCFVLGIHAHAAHLPDNPHCLIQVRPWLSARSACSFMEISCYEPSQTGNATEFDAIMDEINSEWLAYLIIYHCPAVEITPRFQRLHRLIGLKIFNATLEDWGRDAAATNTHHPKLMFVFIVATNMAAFPPGLYHPDFPQELTDIELSRVNLTELPDTLADVWPAGLFLVLEEMQLPSFPMVIATLAPAYLSIALNNFSTLPPALWQNELLYFINLNCNPLSEIPDTDIIGDAPPAIGWMSIIGTNVSVIPSWITVASMETLVAGSTPLCESLVEASDTSVLGAGWQGEDSEWRQYVNCQPMDEHAYLTHYPINEEAPFNPPNL